MKVTLPVWDRPKRQPAPSVDVEPADILHVEPIQVRTVSGAYTPATRVFTADRHFYAALSVGDLTDRLPLNDRGRLSKSQRPVPGAKPVPGVAKPEDAPRQA